MARAIEMAMAMDIETAMAVVVDALLVVPNHAARNQNAVQNHAALSPNAAQNLVAANLVVNASDAALRSLVVLLADVGAAKLF